MSESLKKYVSKLNRRQFMEFALKLEKELNEKDKQIEGLLEDYYTLRFKLAELARAKRDQKVYFCAAGFSVAAELVGPIPQGNSDGARTHFEYRLVSEAVRA